MKDENSPIVQSVPKLIGMFNKIDASFSGVFTIECRDKYGHVKWREESKNIIVNEGLMAILDIMLHADTQITTWYVAIFESDTTVLATHTYVAPGYTECSAYDEEVRQEYVEAAATTGNLITNSANKAVFTMNDTKTIYGAALVGGSTVAATILDTTTGHKLFASSQFAAGKSVEDDDVLNVTYQVSVTST